MTPSEEFEALDRIFIVIMNYRRPAQDQLNPMNNDSIKSYLVNHLPAPDVQFWLRMEDQDYLSEFVCKA